MDKSKLNIELDPDEIPNAPLDQIYDGVGFERDPNESTKETRKEMKFKKKGVIQSISLHIGDGLRLVERGINKYLGFLVGNNPNPIPQLTWLNSIRLNWIYLIGIIVLLILLLKK